MIKLSHVYMAFSKEYYALYDINLEIERGEKVAIVGELDSGKTCLLRLMLGLESPQKGEVEIAGRKLMPHTFRDDVSALFVSARGVFLENKTCRQNLEFVLKKRGEAPSDILINNALQNFKILPFENEKIKNLNLFNRIMFALARASLRQHFDLVVIDDCFSQLNEAEREQLIYNLKKYLDDKTLTMVFALSDEAVAEKLGLKTVKLDLGSLVKIKKPAEPAKKESKKKPSA